MIRLAKSERIAVANSGGSRIIRGEGEAAGGHRPRDRRIRASEKDRAKFHGALPVPSGEDAVVCGTSGAADLPLLRLRRGRRRIQVRDGARQVHVSRGAAHGRRKMRHPHSEATGTLARRAARKSAARSARRDAPAGGGVFRAAAARGGGGQSRGGVPRGPRTGSRGHEAIRTGIRAFVGRRAASPAQAEVSRGVARSVRTFLARPGRAAL